MKCGANFNCSGVGAAVPILSSLKIWRLSEDIMIVSNSPAILRLSSVFPIPVGPTSTIRLLFLLRFFHPQSQSIFTKIVFPVNITDFVITRFRFYGNTTILWNSKNITITTT